LSRSMNCPEQHANALRLNRSHDRSKERRGVSELHSDILAQFAYSNSVLDCSPTDAILPSLTVNHGFD